MSNVMPILKTAGTVLAVLIVYKFIKGYLPSVITNLVPL